ncbi:hypothetical protein MT325_m708L [Paramecium bursaria chlorella virus MT325]|uniref:Uncharacterized protein m708L n=1 Tax=Paramecium bursaria Chlorella virus MT325 TaxID=346932 RepID=A7IV88_PBCVM|nr:hypothetical protein MT325_m708L [Paramecium bursaria chlorella virus MT325]
MMWPTNCVIIELRRKMSALSSILVPKASKYPKETDAARVALDTTMVLRPLKSCISSREIMLMLSTSSPSMEIIVGRVILSTNMSAENRLRSL